MSSVPATAPPDDRPLSLAQIVDDLIADGLVPREEAETLVANRRYSRANVHPLMVIADQKWKDPRHPRKLLGVETLTQWLAEKCGLPYLHIDPFKIDFNAVTKVMSVAYAERYRILPLSVTTSEVIIATAEPWVRGWEASLKQVLRLDIKRVIANPVDIQGYIVEFYNLARSVKGASDKDQGAVSDIANFEQLVQLGRSGQLDANDQHIVHICDWLFNYAFQQRASDIHLEPRRDAGNVRFRIDGVLHQVYQIPTPVMAAMTSRIKILGRMDVVEKRRPQDGRLKTVTPDGDEVELRLSTMPTAFGEKMVMRIFAPENLVKDYRELGFSAEEENKWHQIASKPHGIILVTGPTGSGKTTTLYSTLKQLAAPEINVCTVEDPIEMVEPSFNQMQVQAGIGVTFASGIRTLMRQDPDIIMVGEIRDLETAEMAIQAALTGHLVLSTLHTNDAPAAVSRLLDIGVPPYLLQSTLLGVMAQRLVRTLCPHCKVKHDYDDAAWNALVAPWKAANPKGSTYTNKGCLECRMTGYMGRIGIYEMMIMTPPLRDLLVAATDLEALRDAAYKEGMKPLRISGAMKIAAGQTTIDEIMKVAPPPAGDRRKQGR
ncbi:MAG: type secretory pathway, ATPase PulE/Tfp pilus assembly pathway, ATPase PilB [Proteobacteria bacterium]|nr:type secretory pathway, ATPase PulE/Tfp pilus assembly pathway, ATPase PilB [Pseudomonadota bacterium]